MVANEGKEKGPTKRILIVEDDAVVRRLLVDALSPQSYEIVETSDAVRALALIEEATPDCIIADVLLPSIDGFRFRQILLETPTTRDIPFVFLTSLTTTEDQVRGLALEADDFIVKPFQGDVLIGKIKNLLSKSDRYREASYLDPLTSCYNRRFFDMKLDEEIARAARYGESFTLVMIDIDRFKQVNDTWGHIVGDRILVYFADFTRKRKRSCDLFFRFGGDEFILLLPRIGTSGGLTCAERIRTSLDQAARDTDQIVNKMPITASAGVASFPVNGVDRTTLVKACDDALYRAKEGGRNRVECAANLEPASTVAGD
ncbi:MAG: diguanylate cyclase [Deltaproteobacteria bacterium]|nr:diguanylate cyclase [Deltaproteobacteria bacterium]